GDQLTLTVEGLGEQRHTVVAEAQRPRSSSARSGKRCTGPLPWTEHTARSSAAKIAAVTYSLAEATASGREAPLASSAAMAADSVQPVPWVLRVSARGASKLTGSVPSNRISVAVGPSLWPPLIRTDRAPASFSFQACIPISYSLRAGEQAR